MLFITENSDSKINYINRKEIREYLFLETEQRCAYCEQEISRENSDIEHIKPKSKFPQLFLQWDNLTLICVSCNSRKSDRILHLNPYKDEPLEHLRFKEDGVVFALSDFGNEAIQMLGLNRIELIEKRYQKYNYLKILLENYKYKIDSIDEENSDLKINISNVTVQKIYELLLQSFFSSSLNVLKDYHFNEIKTLLENADQTNEKVKELKELLQKKTIELSNLIRKDYFDFKDLDLDLNNSINIKEYRMKKILIESIEIKNFRNIKNVNFEFDKIMEKKVVPSLLLIGENGTGKSSILQAIVYALLGERSFNEEKSRLLNEKYLRIQNTCTNDNQASVKIKLTDIDDFIELIFDSKNAILKTSGRKLPILAYGTIRLLSNKIQENSSYVGLNIKNLFDHRHELIDAEKWLLSLENNIFDDVSNLILKDILMLDDKEYIGREGNEVRIMPINIPIKSLSDGYKSVLSLVCDILANMKALWDEEPKLINDYTGVVLIDEIELHLHPKWKYELYPRLKKVFPQIQFIITTHDPLCILNANKGEVHILNKNEMNDVIVSQIDVPKGKRIDQLLTGEWFSLNSALDKDTINLLINYQNAFLVDSKEHNVDILRKKLTKRLSINADNTFWGIYNEVIKEENLGDKVFFNQIEKDDIKNKIKNILNKK